MPSIAIHWDGRAFTIRHLLMTGPTHAETPVAMHTTCPFAALAAVRSWILQATMPPAPAPPPSHLDSRADAAAGAVHIPGAAAGIDTPSRWPAAALNPWPREPGR